MPFPFSAEGTVVINANNLERVISAVEAAVRKLKPTALSRDGQRITFRAHLFRFVSNWNLLVPIGSGELRFSQEFDRVQIEYSISFVQLFIAITAMVIVMFGIVPIASEPHTVAPLGFLPVAWLGLFGANYLTTIFRFPRFLRRAAEKA